MARSNDLPNLKKFVLLSPKILFFLKDFSETNPPGNWHTKFLEAPPLSVFFSDRLFIRVGSLHQPRRGVTYQPRATPWVWSPLSAKALKGRDIVCSIQDVTFSVVCDTLPQKLASSSMEASYVTPFQGFVFCGDLYPGRCPGLVCHAPAGLIPTSLRKVSATLEEIASNRL